MIIKRVGALSLGKFMAVMYGGIGLLFGGLFSLFSLLGGGALLAAGGEEGAAGGVMMGMGVAAIIIFPIFYGILGFIGGLISALFFNIAARITGGLEVDIQ